MNIFNKRHKFILLLSLLGLGVSAQDHERIQHILALEIQDSLGSWRRSDNAAGLAWDKPTDFSIVRADYGVQSGAFKRPQEALQTSGPAIYGAGNIHMGKYYLQGFFSYKRERLEDVLFNTSLIDPFRDMPYMVLDSNASDWINQHYAMGFEWATPKFADRWSLGLGMRYQTSSGAKQRDIRAENNHYVLQIRPSVTYALHPRHIVGLHVSYDNMKEESNNRNVNNRVDQGYYLYYGLGHAVPYLGSGTTMDYKGDKWGLGLQYEYKGNWNVFASSTYILGAETADIGFVQGRTNGMVLNRKSSNELVAKRMLSRGVHQVNLNYEMTRNKGMEYWNEFVPGLESEGYINRYRATRSTYYRDVVQGRYTFLIKGNDAYSWKFDANVDYEKRNDAYLLPISTFNMENLAYGLSVQKAFTVGSSRASVVSVGGRFLQKQNLTGNYQYGGERPDEIPATELMQGELRYGSADYLVVDIPLTYSIKLGDLMGSSMFVRANAYWLNPADENMGERKGLQLSLGATF